jgi:hypothetical protein
MVLLRNGKVLVAGGFDDAGEPLHSAELYDPVGGTWSDTGAMLGSAFASAMLPDGKVLVLGVQVTDSAPFAETYDPTTDEWTPTAPPNVQHDNATLLEPVMHFFEEMSVLCKYIPALGLGCRRAEQVIRVTSAMKSGSSVCLI